MGLFRNVAVVALFAGAYASNPDEQSFRRYVDDEMKKKVISHLAANMYRRHDYYFFSLVRLPEDKLTFVGMFGNWFRVPTSVPKTLPKQE